MRFLSKRHIHVFCKHPRKLEIKSVGDISDDTFYHTSLKCGIAGNINFRKCRISARKRTRTSVFKIFSP